MKWIKGYVAGLLTALLLCGLVVTAGAKSGKVMQELDYRDIRVSLDGEVLDLRNAIGEKVEPFMFGGTNYLPVRALAEALGLNVAWDGKEVMVVLTTPQPIEPEPESAPVASGDAIMQPSATVTSGDVPEPVAEAENSTPASEPETMLEPAPVEDTEPEPAKEPEIVKTPESPNMANLSECHVEIKKARLARNYDDTFSIVVTIQWTNNSEYAQSSLTAMKVKALQKGEELPNSYPDDFDSDLYLKRVEPGETLEIEKAFALTDNRNRVEIVITNLSGESETSAKMTFNPSDMKQPSSVRKAQTSAPTVTNSRTVYVTKTGKHYHYNSTCNGGTYYASTLSEALARKLTPCDKCVLTGN